MQSNAEAIADLCIRREGLPLAIELAAARVKFETPQGMLSRLKGDSSASPHRESRLDFLKGGPTDLPARQRTIRGALAWSYDLLSNSQQRLFRNLAVFEGGFTPDAAQHICYPEDASAASGHGQEIPVRERCSAELEGLAGASLLCLPDQMAVREGQDDGKPRFTMLETVREFAIERLEETGPVAGLVACSP